MNREDWLNAFAQAAARPFMELSGYAIPDNVRISVGFPLTGSKKSKAIGQCWDYTASKDGHFEIFIHPKLGDTKEVAAVLTHELVHAVVGLEAKHGPEFKGVFHKVGMTGKATQCATGEAWAQWALPVLADLGDIPHAALDGGRSNAPKEQKNRQMKAECDACGFIFRASRQRFQQAIDEHGGVRCPTPDCDGVLSIDMGAG